MIEGILVLVAFIYLYLKGTSQGVKIKELGEKVGELEKKVDDLHKMKFY